MKRDIKNFGNFRPELHPGTCRLFIFIAESMYKARTKSKMTEEKKGLRTDQPFKKFDSAKRLNTLILSGFLLILGSQSGLGQNSESYFYENELGLSIPLKDRWSMDVGFGNRGMFQERQDGEKISGYQHEHLEINHFTNYSVQKSVVLSLGLRYRFRELFDEANTDEFRIVEQVGFAPASSALSHRIRLEQRFRENTIHRLRYELGYTKTLSSIFALGLATEALYAVSAHTGPEAEQRFSVGLENSSFRDLELELALEYHLENYLRDLGHEFYLITGVSLSL